MTHDLLMATNEKNICIFYKEFRQTPPNHVRYTEREENMKKCRKTLRKNIEKAKRNHYFKTFNKCKSDMKKTWHVINSMLTHKDKNDDIMLEIDGKQINNLQTIVDKFNEYFINIGQHTVDSLNQDNLSVVSYKDFLENPSENTFTFEEVSENRVIQLITDLKQSNTKSHDLISNKLLKIVKSVIAKPLTYLINQSIKTIFFLIN